MLFRSYYCRLRVGTYQSMNGQPLNEDHQAYKVRCQQAWEIVTEWLTGQGLDYLGALVATPRDLVMLDGWCDFLTYDKETKSYRRAEAEAA